jgi:hypothetical protein
MSLKDWMRKVETAQLNEFATNGQIQIKPASQMPKPAGQQQQQGSNTNQPGQANPNTQVITQGDKTLGTVDNPQLAQQIKQSIGKGEMSLAGDDLQEDDVAKTPNRILQKGSTVTVPHKGKQITGKIVRYESGKNGYSDAYVVDVGD